MKRTLFTLALLLTSMVGMAQVQMQRVQSSDIREGIEAFAQQKRMNEPVRFKDGTSAVSINFADETAFTLGVTPTHGVQYEPYRFVRMTDSTGTEWTNDYSWTGRYWGMTRDLGFSVMASNMRTSSEELGNGFIMVTPLDAVQKGQNYWGRWDTWAKINAPINTTGWRIVDVRITQAMQRANNDNFLIDWCTDGLFTPGNFDSIIFNRNYGIYEDIAGEEVIPLPPMGVNIPTVGQESLYIRVRYSAPATQDSRLPGGIYWFIDDLRVEEGLAYRIAVHREGYGSNAYGLVPQGLKLAPVEWAAAVQNRGGSDITSLHPTLYTYKVTAGANEGDPDVYTAIGSPYTSDLNTPLTIDSASIIFAAFLASGVNEQGYPTFEGNPALPSSEMGTYALNIQLPVNPDGNGTPVYTATRDTVYYHVVDSLMLADAENRTYSGMYRFGRDRNILWSSKSGEGVFAFSFDNATTYSTSNSTLPAGWRVCLEYTAQPEATKPWYIRGVEVVPAADSCEIGTTIKASLWQRNPEAQSVADYLLPVVDADGHSIESDVHDITPADLNSITIPSGKYYASSRDFNTVFLPFAKKVVMDPEVTYYACYEMINTGKFFAGQDPYSGAIGMGGNFYMHPNAFLFTPNTGSPDCGRAIGRYLNNQSPMVRMIVSPNPPDVSISDVANPFSSMNAYPNPANKETSISYSLKENGNVSVRLFDIVGKEILNLPQGNQAAGIEYQVSINTENLANGVYFYTINANGMQQTKKLVVNR